MCKAQAVRAGAATAAQHPELSLFLILGAYWDGFTEYGRSMESWQATSREASCLAGGEDGGASGRSLLALTDGPLPFSVVRSSKSLV